MGRLRSVNVMCESSLAYTLSWSRLGHLATLGRSDNKSKERRAPLVVTFFLPDPLDSSSSGNSGLVADVSKSAERLAAARLMPSMPAPSPCRLTSPPLSRLMLSWVLSPPNRVERLLRRGLRIGAAWLTAAVPASTEVGWAGVLAPPPTPNRSASRRPNGEDEAFVEACCTEGTGGGNIAPPFSLRGNEFLVVVAEMSWNADDFVDALFDRFELLLVRLRNRDNCRPIEPLRGESTEWGGAGD